MKIKSGTTNDLVLHEIRRGDIVSKLKDRQYNFFKKLREIEKGDALVTDMIDLCKNDDFISYYSNLNPNNYKEDIRMRTERIHNSDNSMAKYYVDMNFMKESCIYNSFVNDKDRVIITRWRLSNHDLKIETGRYSGIPRGERRCDICDVMEDEAHVIFRCPRYEEIRTKYQRLIDRNDDTKSFLDPNFTDIYETSRLLHEVEAFRKK